MIRCAGRWLGGLGLGWLGMLPSVGFAQARLGSAAPTAVATPGSMANPYANPYMNPFLNPYAAMNPGGRDGTMMYFLAARQQQQQAELAAAQAAPAPAASKRRAGIPSGAASRYFQRTIPVSARAMGYYQRYNQYYPGIDR